VSLVRTLSTVHTPHRPVQLSLSLEALVFGAIALTIFHLALSEALSLILTDINFISQLTPRGPPPPFPPFPHQTHIMLRVAVSVAAHAALPILGIYLISSWAMKGFLEASRFPIVCTMIMSLCYSLDTAALGRTDGYAALALTVMAVLVAVQSRGFRFWITTNR
jgi:hypothetical protein